VTAKIRLEPFRPEAQGAARALILRGLGDHWGVIREDLNPDLDDIGRSYAPGYFVLAWAGDALVGTGGLLPWDGATVQIQRVSVASELRRRGVGSLIVADLLGAAEARGFDRVILETTESWTEIVAFWKRQGFQPFDRRDGDLYFSLELGNRG
jgi:ribosomal protein S18 acetylase RimI-like enzyme